MKFNSSNKYGSMATNGKVYEKGERISNPTRWAANRLLPFYVKKNKKQASWEMDYCFFENMMVEILPIHQKIWWFIVLQKNVGKKC